MNEVIKFLKENSIVYLATVEKGEPRVRPFQFMLEDVQKLYFCTGNTKEAYKQLKAYPLVEFTTSNQKYEWIRVRGEVRFINDLVIKAKILESNQLVKSIYKTPDNQIFEVFCIEHGKAILADFSGQPPKEIKF